MSQPLTDDQITDAIASEVAERVTTTHPNLDPDRDPELAARLARIYTLHAVGRRPEGFRLTEVADIMGDTPKRIHELERRAIVRAKRAYLTYIALHPELFES